MDYEKRGNPLKVKKDLSQLFNMALDHAKFQSPALGEPIPDSRHACVSSLPTFRDVHGYETGEPRVIEAMKTGYPRFVVHPLVVRCQELAGRELLQPGESLVLLNSARGLTDAEYFLQGLDWFQVCEWEGTTALVYSNREPRAARIKSFLQHTGCRISSRRAEAILVSRGVLARHQKEELSPDLIRAQASLDEVFAELYPEVPEKFRFLGNSGMNSFFSVFRFLQQRAQRKGRRRWLQLGWLYLDTMEILEKFIPEDHELVTIERPGNTEEILRILNETPGEWAGVITEFPTNPMLECFDLPVIGEWCHACEVPLVVDPTLVTAWNVKLFPHADIVVTSYTKYGANEGDVMAGGVVIRADFPEAEALAETLSSLLEPLYEKDLRRLAVEIRNMREVVKQTGIHNRILVERLENHPAVKCVLAVHKGATAHLYDKVKRENGGPGALATVIFRNPQIVYDTLRMGKGPSFGLQFSLCCPFLYLAHYSLVTTDEGRDYLLNKEMDPELIRFSFGMEDPEELWERLEEAIRAGDLQG